MKARKSRSLPLFRRYATLAAENNCPITSEKGKRYTMSMRTPGRVLLYTALVALLMVVTAVPAAAQEGGEKKVSVGVEYRSIGTHFSEYTSGLGTLNSWETFSLYGIAGDMLWKVADKENFSIYAGGGASLLIGGYDYEVGIYTGSGSAGPALAIRAVGEIDYPLNERFTLLGQLGASLLYMMAGKVDDDTGIYSAYEDSFGEGIPCLSLGIGAQGQLSGGRVISGMLQFQLVDLGAWSDYWIVNSEPANEGASTFLLRFNYFFKH